MLVRAHRCILPVVSIIVLTWVEHKRSQMVIAFVFSVISKETSPKLWGYEPVKHSETPLRTVHMFSAILPERKLANLGGKIMMWKRLLWNRLYNNATERDGKRKKALLLSMRPIVGSRTGWEGDAIALGPDEHTLTCVHTYHRVRRTHECRGIELSWMGEIAACGRLEMRWESESVGKRMGCSFHPSFSEPDCGAKGRRHGRRERKRGKEREGGIGRRGGGEGEGGRADRWRGGRRMGEMVRWEVEEEEGRKWWRCGRSKHSNPLNYRLGLDKNDQTGR